LNFVEDRYTNRERGGRLRRHHGLGHDESGLVGDGQENQEIAPCRQFRGVNAKRGIGALTCIKQATDGIFYCNTAGGRGISGSIFYLVSAF